MKLLFVKLSIIILLISSIKFASELDTTYDVVCKVVNVDGKNVTVMNDYVIQTCESSCNINVNDNVIARFDRNFTKSINDDTLIRIIKVVK